MTAYADGIFAALLRAAAIVPPDGPDSRVYTRQIADLDDRMPCIIIRALPGGEALQATADGSRNVPWQLDVYYPDTADGGRASQSACRRAVRALLDAAGHRTNTSDGYLTSLTAIAGPYDAADGGTPAGVSRWQATGLAGLRKPF